MNRFISCGSLTENLDLDEMEFEGLDDEDLINAVFDLFCERNDFE